MQRNDCFGLVNNDRRTLTNLDPVYIPAIRLFKRLPEQPMITVAKRLDLTGSTKPTTDKAIESLVQVGVFEEITGKQRDRIFAYRKCLDVLAEGPKSPFKLTNSRGS